jgi:uncharacterized membrane protein
MRRPRAGLLGAAIGFAGLAVAGYLTAVKLAGELPACGPLRGCETVALSEYSAIAGIPIALFGAGLSAIVVGLQLAWWRTGQRRVVIAAYGLGLFGILIVAYLTYLELVVIGAVCVWCVGYAVTVVAGWAVAAIELRPAPGRDGQSALRRTGTGPIPLPAGPVGPSPHVFRPLRRPRMPDTLESHGGSCHDSN